MKPTVLQFSHHFAHRPDPALARPRVRWAEEVVVEDEEWLVERLIPTRAYVGIFGRRGSAKSFLALDLAFRGARGEAFLDRPCRPFGAVYCVGEKQARFGKRVEAWKQSRGLGPEDRLPLMIRDGVPNLLDDASVDRFITELDDYRAGFEERGAPLSLVVLDTLTRSIGGGSVSDAESAGMALHAIQRIIERAGVTVIPLAHVAKAGGDTQKGMGEWEDYADALIRIDREAGAARRKVTVTKQSDDEDGSEWAFELDRVEVGERADGRAVTSCVVRQVETEALNADRRLSKLTPGAQIVLRVLHGLLDRDCGEPAPPLEGVKRGARAVRLEDLRKAAYTAGIYRAEEPEKGIDSIERSRWTLARRKAFGRAIEQLQLAKAARVHEDLIWPTT